MTTVDRDGLGLFDDSEIDPHLDTNTVNEVLTVFRSVGATAAQNRLELARENIRRERETLKRDAEERARGARRFLDQTITDQAFKRALSDLSDLPPEVQARLIALRNRDVMAFAAELGLARMAEAERRAKESAQ